MHGHRLQNITPYNSFSQISKKVHTQHQQTITKNKNKNKQSKTTNQSQYNSLL